MNVLATPEALRHTLQLLDPILKGFVIPSGKFDPVGPWRHSYQIASLCVSQSSRAPGGQLTIHRMPQPNGAVLEVTQQWILLKKYAAWGKAVISCAADCWSTPRRWTVETWTTRPDGQEEADGRLKFAVEPVGQELRFSGVRKPPLRVGPQWTLDWALLDALQRRPTDAGDLSFDLVEDYDMLRPRQHLLATGPITTKLGGKTAELWGFCRWGTGTLPTHFWLDEQHRLLFVIHYLRAYVLQPNLPGDEQ